MNQRSAILQRRRIDLLVALLIVAVGLLGFKLIQIQIIDHDKYQAQASINHTRKYEIPSTRGQLYAMDNQTPVPLALNQTLKVVYADPRYVKDFDDTSKKLGEVLELPPARIKEKLSRPRIQYVELATRVPDDQADRIRELRLRGIGMIDRDYRTYPEGSLGAQVLGFVNADGAGQYGVEGYLNKELAGTPGQLAAQTDTNGIPIATAKNTISRPKEGRSYVLTIDRNVQAMVERELAEQVQQVRAKSGSVIVLDPRNGAIRAMANYPTFDPNEYSKVKDYSVFTNAVTGSPFEPGSGIKAFTLAAGLNEGKITPDSTFIDQGKVKVGDRVISNVHNEKLGTAKSMTVVLRDSLNTGVVHVFKLLGGNAGKITMGSKKTLHDYFTERFGLGHRTGVEQAGEAPGHINAPADTSESSINYANMSFGQGMSVTMVQMAAAMAAVANGGKLFQPHVVAGTLGAEGEIDPKPPRLLKDEVISETSARQLTGMLEAVVEKGSGYRAGQENPGYRIAGKTGTAQIPDPNGRGYLANKNIGSFVGFAPAEKPEFVVMVRIDQPGIDGYAEKTAVPVFSDICRWLFRYYAIPPSS